MATQSTFLHLGYLSDDSESYRAFVRSTAPEQFEAARQRVATALSDIAAIACPTTGSPAEVAAFGFWIRTLEACQGAYLLAERGMAASALALLRTGYECLFHACALWRVPEVAQKIENEHHIQRLKQAKGMRAAGVGKLSQIHLQELDEIIAADEAPKSGYSTFEAARDAGLIFEYEERYRGLSLVGAHASLRSLDTTYELDDNGGLDFDVGPDIGRVGWILRLISDCLTLGIERFREVFPNGDAA